MPLATVRLWQWFTLGGSLLQIGGFLAVVMASTYELARDYSEYGPLGKLWLRVKGWWLYWFGTLAPPMHTSIYASDSIAISDSVTVSRSNESDIDRLTREVAELRTRLAGFEKVTVRRLKAADERVSSLHKHFTERADTLQGRLDAVRRGTLRKERRGALAFVLGTALVLVAAFV